MQQTENQKKIEQKRLEELYKGAVPRLEMY